MSRSKAQKNPLICIDDFKLAFPKLFSFFSQQIEIRLASKWKLSAPDSIFSLSILKSVNVVQISLDDLNTDFFFFFLDRFAEHFLAFQFPDRSSLDLFVLHSRRL